MDQRVKMTPKEKLESLGNVLDKLGDLPGGGRSKCGLIWVANDIINGLNQDILIYEEHIKMLEGKNAKKDSDNEEDADVVEEIEICDSELDNG